LCHTIQHRAVLIIFPLNLQTLTITRMLSSGGEGFAQYNAILSTQNMHMEWKSVTGNPQVMKN